jgi:hypothetical protein
MSEINYFRIDADASNESIWLRKIIVPDDKKCGFGLFLHIFICVFYFEGAISHGSADIHALLLYPGRVLVFHR